MKFLPTPVKKLYAPLVVGALACVFPLNGQVIQANSPEDFWRPRSHALRIEEIQQLIALGANERFGILNTIGGDSNNTTSFNNDGTINGGFLAEVTATVAESNKLGMAFEVVMFEQETARRYNRQQRIALARELGDRLCGMDVTIDICEESPLHGNEVIELIDAIHDECPDMRVVIHNGNGVNEAETLLVPLVGSDLWGVSGQVIDPARAVAFVDVWHDAFPHVVINEIGPGGTGFPPCVGTTDCGALYRKQRKSIYASMMSGGGVGIYYGVDDQGTQVHSRWADAFAQANIAGDLCVFPNSTFRPDLTTGDPCVTAPGEWRIYYDDGMGRIVLPKGTYKMRRFSPVTGLETRSVQTINVGNGFYNVNRPSGEGNEDRLVIIRTPALDSVAALLRDDLLPDMADGKLLDAGSVVFEGTR